LTQGLTDFHAQHFPRKPEKSPEQFENDPIPGVQVLGHAPAVGIILGTPKSGEIEGEEGENKYLWVIDARGICYILEAPLGELNHNPPKHSNLTGGGKAYIGGEMWFKTHSSMWIIGKSGRYPARNKVEWEDAVGVFKSFGYMTISPGWDKETGYPSGAWRGS
jgi:hypothetical protein